MKICPSCESILQNKTSAFQGGVVQACKRVCHRKNVGDEKTCLHFFAIYLLSEDLDEWFENV